ncbi:DUF7288 family protein [Natrialbaceae archaeon A-gly3]
MREQSNTETERGQAHTLEGLMSAMVVLMAVLFAIQSVVITPTTGGAVDRTVQSQLQTEVKDALIVADAEGDLSEMVRYWNVSDDDEVTFENATAPESSRGEYRTGEFEADFLLGEILESRFGEQGQNYNVELHTQGDEESYLVYQGQPSSSAVTASYTVTLYNDQHLTASGYEGYTLEEAADEADDDPPIEKAGEDPVYNVVEVRVIVW